MTRDGFFPPSDIDANELARRLSENLPPRVHAESLLRYTLLEVQLAAIKALLHRNQQAEAATRIEFEELNNKRAELGPDSDHLDALHDDRFWQAVFQDSAHSMSAVGMLAPIVESLFVAVFDGLRKREDAARSDTRRERADDQFWNPQIFFGKEEPRKDIVVGIDQLAMSCGLNEYLPEGYQKTLAALFAYRNNMLHNGFEWPAETIRKFSQRIASAKWPEEWFASTDKGGEPWLYYMSPEFCTHCTETIDGIIEGVGRYLKEADLALRRRRARRAGPGTPHRPDP
jgi:hypothetical protein